MVRDAGDARWASVGRNRPIWFFSTGAARGRPAPVHDGPTSVAGPENRCGAGLFGSLGRRPSALSRAVLFCGTQVAFILRGRGAHAGRLRESIIRYETNLKANN
jgi:hypothetical protein